MSKNKSRTEKASSSAAMPNLAGRSLWSDAMRRLRRDWVAMLCFGVIVLYALVALFSQFMYRDFNSTQDYDRKLEAPSADHWFGTDTFGRDVFAKTLLGAKVSMTVGFMANIIAVPIGMALGMIGGYFGKRIDDFVVWLYNTWASIPGLILLIAIKFAFQNVGVLFEGTPFAIDMAGIHGLYIALGIRSWIGTCRIVRAETFKLKELDYITAARALGQGHLRIIFRHITPNLLHLGIINFSLGFVGAVTAEVMLSYLGLGVSVGTPSWGTMINAAQFDLVVGRWWEATAACTAMFFLVLALNLFGDRLRDALDPRLRTA